MRDVRREVARLETVPTRSATDYQRMVESVVDYAIFMLDPGGHVLTWNLGAERIKGYQPSEIIGSHFSRFYPDEDIDSGKPEHELEVAASVGRFEDEGWRLRKDGSRFWANVIITALRDDKGELRGFGKVTRDLTGRRNAEVALRLSEERFRLFIENIVDYALYLLDPDGKVASWNLGAERMKGYRAEEIIGRSFSVFFPAEDIASGKHERELAIAREAGRFEDEGWRVRKDGSRFWANAILTPLHDEHGTLFGYAKITRDLTARKEAEETDRRLLRERTAREVAEAGERALRESEERYRQAAQMAEDASRAKDEFLATVSHELRTPLSAIFGWASLLKAQVTDASSAKAIEVIHRNAVAQARIIDDILDVSRVITGKFRIEARPADLVGIAREAMEVVRPSAIAKKIELELTAAPACLLVVDPERLQQVLWNLLSNAVKFTDAGGRIHIDIRQEGSSVVIAVSDTGRGIEASFLPFVFDRFKQADSSRTRRVGGLGLGLALVRHIVELHGGRVAASSDGLGKGSVFTVTLPIRAVVPADPDAPPRPGRATAKPSVLNGVRVLVVDDEPDARDLIVTVLSDAGALVEEAQSAPEAFDAFRRFRPSVVVSDIGMPDEDGYSFMRRVRALDDADGNRTPSLALTAFTRDEDRTRALGAGFTSHLGKPVHPDTLVSAVANLAAVARRS